MKKVKKTRILSLGGAFIGLCMGSGFASGQEILQFFSSFGLFGSLGAGAVALLIFTWVASTVMADGKKLGTSVGIYRYYCGQRIGSIFEFIIPLLMFAFLNVMFSGAGAAINEYLGLPTVVGIAIIAFLCVITVLLGLRRLIQIIGSIGIIILLLAAVISIVSLFSNWQAAFDNIETTNRLKMPMATFDSWWISGLLYASFNMVTALPFLSGLGSQARNIKEAFLAGSFGSSSYIFAGILMNLAFIANIGLVCGKEIPFLALANSVFPGIGYLFFFLLIAGIYTTAVPLLWSICDIIYADKKNWTYPITVIAITGLAFIGGHLPFGLLIGSVYPIIGLIGLILIAFIFFKKLGD
ncbi:MAG: hypothetical protein GX076_03975 [Clostridiales bacterium]|nr:hypothetical protein [Clostridiales bacterium]